MANVLEYKGYIATLEYSSEDKVFYGKLEMINDLVTFEADSASDLEVNFHNAVDEYLDTCKALGREPQKTYKGVFNVRIDPKLHKKAYQKSIEKGISLNAFVKNAIEKEVALEDG